MTAEETATILILLLLLSLQIIWGISASHSGIHRRRFSRGEKKKT